MEMSENEPFQLADGSMVPSAFLRKNIETTGSIDFHH